MKAAEEHGPRGASGPEGGYWLMIGAEVDDFSRLEPIFGTLAPPGGYECVCPAGSGHFSRMVHNGIEWELGGHAVCSVEAAHA